MKHRELQWSGHVKRRLGTLANTSMHRMVPDPEGGGETKTRMANGHPKLKWEINGGVQQTCLGQEAVVTGWHHATTASCNYGCDLIQPSLLVFTITFPLLYLILSSTVSAGYRRDLVIWYHSAMITCIVPFA